MILIKLQLSWPFIYFKNSFDHKTKEDELLDKIFGRREKRGNSFDVVIEYYHENGGCVWPPLHVWSLDKERYK